MTLFYVRSAASGTGTGASWTNAKTTIAALMTSGVTTVGDIVYVADDHNESTTPGAQVNWYANGASIICVDRTASGSPYVEADLRTSAVVTYNGNACDVVLRGGGYLYGITINNGVGATTSSGSYQTTGRWVIEKFNLNYPAAITSSSGFWFQTSGLNEPCEYNDCVFNFPNVSSNPVNQYNGKFRRCSWTWAYTSGVFFGAGQYSFEDCDLSGFPNMTSGGSRMFEISSNTGPSTVKNCKLSTTVKFTNAGGVSNANPIIGTLDIMGSSTDGGAVRNERWGAWGTHITSATVVRTGGANDGVDPIGHKYTLGSGASAINYFEGMPLQIYNSVVEAGMITVSVEGVGDPNSFSALPKNSECWLDVEYPSNTRNGLGVTERGLKNIFTAGVAHAASTQAWDSKLPARAASTAYALGDVIKVAGNPGRIFICTTAGNSSNDATGTAYNSAVDGGTVNESSVGSGGTAVFKAGWRFRMQVQLGSPSPKRVGMITAYVKMAKASAVVYIDPKITLS